MPNRLAREQSPYLRQHAGNPVDWYPWGEEALARARAEDRPLFVSIGYSTCHWCHVMERESFEDPEVARLLNDGFVPVKVDREERPDIDSVYMTVCQMMTGHGGWPLTIVATPAGEPFFAATYLPRESRAGRAGLLDVLPRLVDIWRSRRSDVDRSAASIREALARSLAVEPAAGDAPGAAEMEAAYRALRGRFDPLQGGFGRAPKFPTPHNLLFLLRWWNRSGEDAAREMVDVTLRAMRRGGLFDQVGFGFHRYSTDPRWLVPHFEKMLYDQALLALAYLEGWLATGHEGHARTVREIWAYVLRDLRHADGGFLSAEDADSEGSEGRFYLWTDAELREALPDEEIRSVAREAWGVRAAGNFADEATGRRTGANVLHRAEPLATVAERLGLDEAEAGRRLEAARERLLEARGSRPRPAVDDKVLADWNGLAIAALARSGAVLQEPAWIAEAARAARFVLRELRTDAGMLLHRWRAGEAGIPGFAEDHACLAWGLTELFEATGDVEWLEEALRLARVLEARFRDPEHGGFFRTAADGEPLLVREKESWDGAVPSANSVAAGALLRLGRITGDPGLERRGRETIGALRGRLLEAPSAHTALLCAVDLAAGPGTEIVVVGDADDPGAADLLAEIRGRYLPRSVLLRRPAGDGPAARSLARLAPFTAEMGRVDDLAAAYVCRDFSCRTPVTTVAELSSLLDEVVAGG